MSVKKLKNNAYGTLRRVKKTSSQRSFLSKKKKSGVQTIM